MSKQEAGSKGGKETVKRYGKAWMRELGKRGIQATANKYFAGSIAECMAYLRKKGAELFIVRLADEEQVMCIEVPVILDPDEDFTFEEPGEDWRQRVGKSKARRKAR